MIDESTRRRSPRCRLLPCLAFIPALLLAACGGATEEDPRERLNFSQTGELQSMKLDEVSGLALSARHEGLKWVHNDDGKARIYAIDAQGNGRGHLDIEGGDNRDWEDLALVPGDDHDWLVGADVGDNFAQRDTVTLYVVAEPKPGPDGKVSGNIVPHNIVELSWPEGPRDCESVAWDPVGEQLLLLSKRDKPPRLYAISKETLFGELTAEATFLGEVTSLRPPTPDDKRFFGKRTDWISQPTGLDLSRDGTRAALITYRSLYLWNREPEADWLETLNQPPSEVVGPPGGADESVAFTADGQAIYIIPEGEGAAIYRYDFADQP